MRNISPSILPNFHRKRNEDPKTFLFEFEVLYRSYDYLHDAQKLKLFPTTLKDSTLKWFINLGVHSITTWGQMKKALLSKYRDYCIPNNLKYEVLKMTKKKMKILKSWSKGLFTMLREQKLGKILRTEIYLKV